MLFLKKENTNWSQYRGFISRANGMIIISRTVLTGGEKGGRTLNNNENTQSMNGEFGLFSLVEIVPLKFWVLNISVRMC